jgi:hypothetical protein
VVALRLALVGFLDITQVRLFTQDSSVAVQDACLLAMLRVSEQCDVIPAEVLSRVSSVAEFSGRHIKRVRKRLSCLS